MKDFYPALASVAILLSSSYATAQNQPLTTLPEGGTTTMYHRSGGAYYAILGNKYATIEYNYLPSEIVEYDNGDVYIKDFFSQYDYTYYGGHPYIKGHRDGQNITFEFPQLMAVRNYGKDTSYFYVSMVEYSSSAKTFIPVSADKNRYTISINDDGTITADIQENGMIFPGKIDHDNEWVYEGEVFSTWTPMTHTIADIPQDMDITRMSMLDPYGMGRFIEMGADHDNIYLRGIFDMAPEAWIKGKRDGKHVTFDSGQYLGFSPSGTFFAFFTAAQYETVYDDEEKEDVRILKFKDSITFDYDESTQKLTAPEGWLLVYNKNPDHINYMEYVESPVIEATPDNISKTPTAPWDLGHHTPSGPDDLEYIYFCISALNHDGQLLDADNLYYRVFINGNPYTFTPGAYTYPGIERPTEFIPFNFDNGGSFTSYDALRIIYMYDTDIETMEIQLYYIEGEPSESNIIASSSLATYPASARNVTPMNPWNISHYVPSKPWDPSESVSFNLSASNTDGENIDPTKLYYRIFFDGEPYTFAAQPGINPEMSFVPVDYSDQYGIAFIVDGTKRTANIYADGMTSATTGVQLYYIEGDPTEGNILAQSDIITDATSSSEMITSLKNIANTIYHNLSGYRIDNPQSGIFIKTVIYTDGSTETTKVRK